MNTIDKILIACAIAVIVFVITMIVIFCIYQAVPDTLIECVFACCSSELVLSFAIWAVKRHSKDKKGQKKNGSEEETGKS